MVGTLFVVATPIGNMEDITLRALRVLKEVDLIACEDTRHTRKLLIHYQISKPTCSYHEHNEIKKIESLIDDLQAGKDIALVCDAGTPLISDPGYRIVRASLEKGIRVSPIPGPCSIISALSVSGRPTNSFTFIGFLPSKRKARRSVLKSFQHDPQTLLIFESPLRVIGVITEIEKVLGPRMVTVVREMTKIYEEVVTGSTKELTSFFENHPPKGEIVLVVEKSFEKESETLPFKDPQLWIRLNELRSIGLTRREIARTLSKELNYSKRTLYSWLNKGAEAVENDD